MTTGKYTQHFCEKKKKKKKIDRDAFRMGVGGVYKFKLAPTKENVINVSLHALK